MVQGTPHGYFPEPTKSVLIVPPQNVPRTEAFYQGYGLQIVMGSHYLEGFVGTKADQTQCQGENIAG